MKKTTGFLAFLTAAACTLASCQDRNAPQTVEGIVMDASMNNVVVVTTAGDTMDFSTMDTDPARVQGVLLDDSVKVTYVKQTLEGGATVLKPTDLTVTVHSPYYYIQGTWVEPIPGMEGMQGVELKQDGTAVSVNMATLQFSQWAFDATGNESGTLMLSYESIGNRQTITGTDTLTVVKLNADSLVLADKGNIVWRFGRGK